MSSSSLLTPVELGRLREVISLGFDNAAKGLSVMVDKEIKVISPTVSLIPIEQVPELIGQPDEVVMALYLRVFGDVAGHILLIFSLEAATELVRMLMGSSSDDASELNEMELSALGEVANVTGSFFLNALGDSSGLIIHPSPPAIMLDMAGAALDIPLLELAMSTEEVLFIDTWFLDNEREIKGLFLVLPDIDSLRLIVERLS
ncbi:MAG: chemotaxis protein CheC [Chloroflexi bacterium]|nr:chemotaxis protein CheC [Chloroflexota bacterium]